MQTGHKRKTKHLSGWIPIALLVVVAFGIGMCIRTGAPEFISPRQALHNMVLWIRLSLADVTNGALTLQKQTLIAESPYYLETIARFRNLIMTMTCGAAIAAGGAVFQILFRNPMAAPNMLGMGSGISLGLLILVVQFSVDAYAMTTRRFVYCLGCAFLMLIVVLLAGKFAGKNRQSVTDMLLAGAVISQIVGVFMTWLMFRMDQDDLIVYQDLSLYGFGQNTTYEFAGRSLIGLILVVALCLLPVILMGFSFDTMCFSEEETRSFGISPSPVRIICIISVAFMVTLAVMFCGTISALSLAIPHICRYFFGSRFRSLLPGTMLMGALVLMICRILSSLIYLEGMGAFPIGTLAGLVAAPLLAMALSKRRRGWE